MNSEVEVTELVKRYPKRDVNAVDLDGAVGLGLRAAGDGHVYAVVTHRQHRHRERENRSEYLAFPDHRR